MKSTRASIDMLYRQHSSSLLLFATTLIGEHSRAQDVVHKVFLKLLNQENLRGVGDAKAYLFKCVRNAILNDAKMRRREVPLNQETVWFEPPHRDYAAELRLRKALDTIPNDQREVIVLHIWGDLTFFEIGEVLGVSSNTAASRYRYALAKLRETMCYQEGCHAEP